MAPRKTASIVRQALVGMAALLLAGVALGATLRTADGVAFSVECAPRLVVPSVGSSATPHVLGGGLRYQVADATGRLWTGVVPGTLQVQGKLVVALAQNPVTHDVYLVYGSPDDPNQAEVSFSFWQGQGWADPRPLVPRVGRADGLHLEFLPQGDAVVAWQALGAEPTVLFRHLELAPSGQGIVYEYLNIGPAGGLVHQVGQQVQMATGLATLAVDGRKDAAYLFLSDSDVSSVGLVRVQLDRGIEGGGFGAPPVPATLTIGFDTQSADPASGTVPIGDGKADGRLIAPYRVELLRADVYYWFEDDAILAVAFRDGVATPLVQVPRPSSDELGHFAILRAVRQELVRDLRVEAALGARSASGTSARR